LVPAGYLSGLTDKPMAHPDHIACLHAANSLMVLVEVVFCTKGKISEKICGHGIVPCRCRPAGPGTAATHAGRK